MMSPRLVVNRTETRIASAYQLRQALAMSAREQFREIWLNTDEDGPSLCALINGQRGWLMYLRKAGDAGFSSRNAALDDTGDMVEYYLSNGQRDVYPASWALPVDQLLKAMVYFVEHRTRAPFIDWHDDS